MPFVFPAATIVQIQVISDIFPFCHPCGKQPGDCHGSFRQIHQWILCKCPELMPFSIRAAVGGLEIPHSLLPSLEPYGGIQKMQAGILCPSCLSLFNLNMCSACWNDVAQCFEDWMLFHTFSRDFHPCFGSLQVLKD